MVFWVEKPSLRLASCCRFEVVNGGAGSLRRSPFLMADHRGSAPLQRAITASASARVLSSAFPSPSPV